MKRITAFVLAVCMLLTVTACGEQKAPADTVNTTVSATAESTTTKINTEVTDSSLPISADSTEGSATERSTSATGDTQSGESVSTEENTVSTGAVTAPPTEENEAPTVSVTAAPTDETTAPTVLVTAAPTDGTTVPTKPVTALPTEENAAPTRPVTAAPTEENAAPTTVVTVAPTAAPTAAPTKAPTAAPTTTTTVCKHTWKGATCTAPKTCTKCGIAEGGMLGHNWKTAVFPTPATCSACGVSASVAYGYQDLGGPANGKALQALYLKLYTACEAFAKSGDAAVVEGKHCAARIQVDLSALTVDQVVTVWKVFKLDHPQYYWLSNSMSMLGAELLLEVDSLYADGDTRSSGNAALLKLKTACETKVKGCVTETDKAMVIHDFVAENLQYAYKADGVTPEDAAWAHNLMGSAQKKKGVCEAYAETYKYLCDQFDVECLIVTGTAEGGPHAWNYVCVDGAWYGVDCTFDDMDQNGTYHHYFGMSAAQMKQKHRADTAGGVGIDYLYELPALAKNGLAPVELYKNGTYVKQFPNVDAAFSAMQDATASYEVRLKTNGGVFLTGSESRITATRTPRVKHLTISGAKTDLGDMYVASPLYVDSALTVQGDLKLNNLDVYGDGSLNLQSYCLTFAEGTVQIGVPLTGSMADNAPSRLYFEKDAKVHLWSAVRVHTLMESEEREASLTVRNNLTVVQDRLTSLHVYDSDNAGITVNVKEVCPPETVAHPRVRVSGAARVTVEKINVSAHQTYINLYFGKAEEFPHVTIGEANSEVHFMLDGRQVYLVGNEQTVESVDPATLTVPVATFTAPIEREKIWVFFTEWINGAGYDKSHNEEYILNSKNQLVRK